MLNYPESIERNAKRYSFAKLLLDVVTLAIQKMITARKKFEKFQSNTVLDFNDNVPQVKQTTFLAHS